MRIRQRSIVAALVGLCLPLVLSSAKSLSMAVGDLDQQFGTGGVVITDFTTSPSTSRSSENIQTLALYSDGEIAVVGARTLYYYSSGTTSNNTPVIARYQTNGTLNSGYPNGAYSNYSHLNWIPQDSSIFADHLFVGGVYVTDPPSFVFELDENGVTKDLYAIWGPPGTEQVQLFWMLNNYTSTPSWGGNQVPDGGFWSADSGYVVVTPGLPGTSSYATATSWVGATSGYLNGDRVDTFQDAVFQPDGKLVSVATANWTDDGYVEYAFGVARFNTNGSLDSSFGVGGKSAVNLYADWSQEEPGSVALQSTGKILVAGYSLAQGGPGPRHWLARLNTNGSLDTSFGVAGLVDLGWDNLGVYIPMIVLPGDKIAVSKGTGIAVLNSDGSEDLNFFPGGSTLESPEYVRDMVLQSDGKLVVATAYEANSNKDFRLARYHFLDVKNGTRTLSVASSGATGVPIGSDSGSGGVANYNKVVATGMSVELTAASSWQSKPFLRWDGCNSTVWERFCTVMVNSNKTVTAVYFVDQDGDGMNDAWEQAHGLNSANPNDANFDPDADGLNNLGEYIAGTEPGVADTDGDDYSDGEEVDAGSDPLSAADQPLAGGLNLVLIKAVMDAKP